MREHLKSNLKILKSPPEYEPESSARKAEMIGRLHHRSIPIQMNN